NPRFPLDTPAAFASALGDMRRHAESAGRNPTAVDVALFAPGCRLGTPQIGRDGKRTSFTGAAHEIAEDAFAYKQSGVKHLVLGIEATSLQDYLDRVEDFVSEGVPLVG